MGKVYFKEDVDRFAARIKDTSIDDSNFYFIALIIYNERILYSALMLDNENPIKSEILAIANSAIPARFVGFVYENIDLLRDNDFIQKYLEIK
jgi:hypothetical protein